MATAKNKYVLMGPEMGASNVPVMKELTTYEGDGIKIDSGFVIVYDNEAQFFSSAIIRLAEGQSIKRKE